MRSPLPRPPLSGSRIQSDPSTHLPGNIVSVYTVFLIALGTALATGLGVIPVLAFQKVGKGAIGTSGSIAAGFMLGASVGLIYEGAQDDILLTAVGAVVGAVLIVAAKRWLGEHEDIGIGMLKGQSGANALMVVAVMTVHSFTEGAAIGVSLAGESKIGLLIAIAIAIHNIPEGVAISLTMLPRGSSVWAAVGWSIFSSLPQPLVAVPAFLAVKVFEPALPAGLGFAGGAMIWMVFWQLLPEAFTTVSRSRAVWLVIVSTVVMIAVEFAIGF
jgi:zinc transporter, ZIP family